MLFACLFVCLLACLCLGQSIYSHVKAIIFQSDNPKNYWHLFISVEHVKLWLGRETIIILLYTWMVLNNILFVLQCYCQCFSLHFLYGIFFLWTRFDIKNMYKGEGVGEEEENSGKKKTEEGGEISSPPSPPPLYTPDKQASKSMAPNAHNLQSC